MQLEKYCTILHMYLLAAIPLKVSAFTGTTESLYILLDRLILFNSRSQIVGTFSVCTEMFTITSLNSSNAPLCNPRVVHKLVNYASLCHNDFTTLRAKLAWCRSESCRQNVAS